MQTTLADWLAIQTKVKAAKKVLDEERALRKAVLEAYFPSPKEGTQSAPTEDGKLVLRYPYERAVDSDALEELHLKRVKAGVDLDSVINYSPKVNLTAYRDLTTTQTKMLDRCLTVKPGSMQLTFVPLEQN